MVTPSTAVIVYCVCQPRLHKVVQLGPVRETADDRTLHICNLAIRQLPLSVYGQPDDQDDLPLIREMVVHGIVSPDLK
jgi:hypothetical protein